MTNWTGLDAIQIEIEIERKDLVMELPKIVDYMAKRKIKCLTVIDHDGKICGLISSENPFNVLRRKLITFSRLYERQLAREKRRQPMVKYSDPINQSELTCRSIS